MWNVFLFFKDFKDLNKLLMNENHHIFKINYAHIEQLLN